MNGKITVHMGPEVTVTIALSRAHYIEAIGMDRTQINMLRAIYEDMYGVDPATLTSEQMLEKTRDGVA